MKEWFDLVLEYGWAYGSEGNKLKVKSLVSAITTGGGKEEKEMDVIEESAPVILASIWRMSVSTR